MGFSVSHTGRHYSKIQIAEALWLFVISTSEFRNPKPNPSWKKIQRKREKHCCFWNKSFWHFEARTQKDLKKLHSAKLGAPFQFVPRVSKSRSNKTLMHYYNDSSTHPLLSMKVWFICEQIMTGTRFNMTQTTSKCFLLWTLNENLQAVVCLLHQQLICPEGTNTPHNSEY